MKNELIVVSEFVRPQIVDSKGEYINRMCIVPLGKTSRLQKLYKLASMEYGIMLISNDERPYKAPDTIYTVLESSDILKGEFKPMGYFSIKHEVSLPIRRRIVIYDIELKYARTTDYVDEFTETVLRFIDSCNEFDKVKEVEFCIPCINIDGCGILPRTKEGIGKLRVEKKSIKNADVFEDGELIEHLNKSVTSELISDYTVYNYNAKNLTVELVSDMSLLLSKPENIFTPMIRALVDAGISDEYINNAVFNSLRGFLVKNNRGILVTRNKNNEVVAAVIYDPSINDRVNIIETFALPVNSKILCMTVTHLPEIFKRIKEYPSIEIDIKPEQLGMYIGAGYAPIAGKIAISKEK